MSRPPALRHLPLQVRSAAGQNACQPYAWRYCPAPTDSVHLYCPGPARPPRPRSRQAWQRENPGRRQAGTTGAQSLFDPGLAAETSNHRPPAHPMIRGRATWVGLPCEYPRRLPGVNPDQTPAPLPVPATRVCPPGPQHPCLAVPLRCCCKTGYFHPPARQQESLLRVALEIGFHPTLLKVTPPGSTGYWAQYTTPGSHTNDPTTRRAQPFPSAGSSKYLRPGKKTLCFAHNNHIYLKENLNAAFTAR